MDCVDANCHLFRTRCRMSDAFPPVPPAPAPNWPTGQERSPRLEPAVSRPGSEELQFGPAVASSFDETEADVPEATWGMAWSLAGLALFLVALIATVIAARQFRPQIAGWLGRSPDAILQRELQRLRQAKEPEDRLAAADAIWELGPAALVRALDQTTEVSLEQNKLRISKPVIQAFADLGEPIVPVLAEALQSTEESRRVAAADILREMGPSAAGAQTALAAVVNDHNRWVRCFATDALANLGPTAAPATKALLAVVEHEDPYTRRRAIVALGRIGPAAKEAVPALRKVEQRDSHEDVREAATIALHQIDLESYVRDAMQRAVPEIRELIERLQEEDQYEAVAAAKSLGKKGILAHEAIPALVHALRSKNKWIREAAAESLGKMGPSLREPKFRGPLEILAADDPEREVREAAAAALKATASGT